MKRTICAMLILLLAGMNSFSQKKNGTIYLEHETIDKTRALWKAFVDGDREKYVGFFTDSIYLITNGQPSDLMPRNDAGDMVTWWKENVENLEIRDNAPAYPDALEYKNAGVWVQDWLLVTGRHIETGINIEMPLHNLYSFNEEGKITSMTNYFDNNILREITGSQDIKENGTVYIHHPYIIQVRKLINSIIDRDLDAWKSFFTEKATFRNLWMESDQTITFDEAAEMTAARMSDTNNKFKIEQMGYPDCVFYELNGYHIVYSWWNITEMRDGKKITYPLMFSHSFNKDGKIFSEFVYASSNHFE